MANRVWAILIAAACGSCGGAVKGSSPRRDDPAATAAVATLQASKFADARQQAGAALAANPTGSRAAAVHAIASYQLAGNEMITEIGRVIEGAEKLKAFDHPAGRAAWQKWLDELAVIEKDLTVAAGDPSFSLELCLACWEHDWNRSGAVDERDRRLFEIESDGKGGELPAGDPRRRPTFRFDVGDAEWALAMVSFQRALGELVLAYKWSDLDKLFGDERMPKLTIRLADASRVKRAREYILNGLDHADKCRTAYLAETDDDREWVPNPRQHSHPVPLAVDAKLYETWTAVINDVRRMLRSEEAISLRELARVADDSLGSRVPAGFIDIGRMLGEPKDIELDSSIIFARDPAQMEPFLRGLLGNGYQTNMLPTPLVGRLRAMKEQIERGEDAFDRKLRYLLWLN